MCSQVLCRNLQRKFRAQEWSPGLSTPPSDPPPASAIKGAGPLHAHVGISSGKHMHGTGMAAGQPLLVPPQCKAAATLPQGNREGLHPPHLHNHCKSIQLRRSGTQEPSEQYPSSPGELSLSFQLWYQVLVTSGCLGSCPPPFTTLMLGTGHLRSCRQRPRASGRFLLTEQACGTIPAYEGILALQHTPAVLPPSSQRA